MANLLEAYKQRLAISEQVYARSHNGEKLSNTRKLATAKCLQNVNNFINEAFENSVGTQRSDLGMFKKFALNLTTVALPNLIANDLVIVYPMSSMTGFINYIKYTAGSTKGETSRGDVLNDPFRLGKVDVNYTSSRVVEPVVAGKVVFAWTPVVEGSVKFLAKGASEYVALAPLAEDKKDGDTLLAKKGEYFVEGEGKIAYEYDNVVIPQNDIPMVSAKMESISLMAKARRVAIYYSQIAAYQAKTDYGFDLGDQLAEKAVGQLSYEIDTEVTDMLIDNAVVASALKFNKTIPAGVSKAEHYEGFSEIVEIGKQMIYDKTQRFAPNYMLIASNILPILTFVKGFQAAPAGKINGPYFAGTLNGVKVYVTPNIKPDKFVLGVNGDDMMSSAAVYAPYMPVVPTQLLQYADGGTSQGWSTLYDLKLLNADLLVAGEVVSEPQVVMTKVAA